MGARSKFYGITTAAHGFDDVGIAQPSGTISAIANASTKDPRYAGKLLLTVNSIAALKKGQAIRITNLDAGHNGATRILRAWSVSTTNYLIVNITYDVALVDGTGNWNVAGGASAWDAMMPIGADLPAANVVFTFWYPKQQGSNESAVDYQRDKIYVFPGVIKSIVITTAGNVRLFRRSTPTPKGALV